MIDRGAALDHPFERGADPHLGFGVDARGRFVEYQDARIVRQGTGEVDELLLPGGKAVAALAQRLIEAPWQGADEVAHVDLIGCGLHPLIGDPVRAQANVLGDGSGEQERVLQHHPEMAAQLGHILFAHIDAIDQNAAALDLVEAHHQADDGGFAGAGVADDRRCLVGLDHERHVFQNPLHLGDGSEDLLRCPRPAGWRASCCFVQPLIGKPDVAELDASGTIAGARCSAGFAAPAACPAV